MSIAFASFAAAWLVAGQTSTATAASPGSSDTEEARLVDMVVADVDGAVVTYSELLSEANLLLLESRGARVARAARLSQNLLRAVLQSMVHRELLLGEIRRLQLRAIDGAEVDRRLVELRRRFDNEAGWQSFLIAAGFRDPDDPDRRVPPALRARLRTEAQVDRFLEVRVRLNVVVTDRDIARCYEARKSAFRGAGVSLVAPRIRRQLRHQRETSALAELVKQLGDRVDVRYDPEFEPKPRPRNREPARAPGSGFTCPT